MWRLLAAVPANFGCAVEGFVAARAELDLFAAAFVSLQGPRRLLIVSVSAAVHASVVLNRLLIERYSQHQLAQLCLHIEYFILGPTDMNRFVAIEDTYRRRLDQRQVIHPRNPLVIDFSCVLADWYWKDRWKSV